MTVDALAAIDELKLEFKKKWHEGQCEHMTFPEIIKFILDFVEERTKNHDYQGS